MSKKRTFISLFSGCGGFDVGFHNVGFHCKGAFDIDELAVSVYNSNFEHKALKHDLSVSSLPTEYNGDYDLVISGSPCQGFSTIGKRQYADPRNGLLLVGGKVAVKHNAKVFIAENVMGSLSGKHNEYWNELTEFLGSNGYKYDIKIINGSTSKLAQTRNRVILFAWKADMKIDIKIPKFPELVLNNVLNDINGAPNHIKDFIDKSSVDYHIASKINTDEKLCDVRGGDRSVHSWEIPEVFGECSTKEIELLNLIMKLRRRERVRDNGDADPVKLSSIQRDFKIENVRLILEELIRKKYVTEVSAGQFDLTRRFNGKYRRLSMDKPSLTVDTNFGNPKYFLHPTEHRGFTVREAARIQGFSDDFVFHGSVKQQFRLIGNAVPPPISKILAEIIKKQIFPQLERYEQPVANFS